MKSFTVYCHTNKINGKKYIGITGMKPAERWGVDGRGYGKQVFAKAIKKYGWNNYEHEILYSNLSREQAMQKEIDLISEYETTNNLYGYNMTSGGQHCMPSEDARRNMSKGKIGNKNNSGNKASENTKKKMSDAQRGERNHNARKVVQLDTNGELVKIYNTLMEASKDIKVHVSSICDALKGRSKTSGGFKWIYQDTYFSTE